MDYTKMLEGKTALITAGAHGMGFSTARLFAQHGANVAVCGRREEYEQSGKYLSTITPKSFFCLTDMSNEKDVEHFCDEALERLGHVDIIVNNVGVNDPQLCQNMTWDKFDRIQNTNIRSIVTINRKLIPQMIERGEGGSVIQISTIHSVASIPTFGSYAVSKGGINAYTRVMAVELGQYGIRCNIVCPGGIRTGHMVRPPKEGEPSFKDNIVRWQGGEPTYGPGNAQDIAMACLFFAGPLSGYTTGCTLMVDGGASNQLHEVDNYAEPDDYEELLRSYADTFISDEAMMRS